MTAILKTLAWKEFHEQKWAVAGVAAVALAIPVSYAVRDVNLALMGVVSSLAIYPVAAGVFFGTRAAAGERTHRSASFVAALPVSHRFLGTTRLISAVVAAIVPLFCLLVLAGILRRSADTTAREAAGSFTLMFAMVVLATVACITVCGAAGLGQPTEIRAGVAGFIGLVVTWNVGFVGLLTAYGFLAGQFNVQYELAQFITALAMVLAVVPVAAELFIGRYSLALGAFVDPIAKGWRLFAWRPGIFAGPVSALMGKAVREMAFLGLEVLGVCLLLSILGGMVRYGGEGRILGVMDALIGGLPIILLVGGFVLAILIGVGAVIGDVQAGVNTFWRSRPILPAAWYWTKYAVGLATMLLAVEIPALAFVGSNAAAITGDRGVFWWLLMWNVTFSFALTATCLVRQPGYAAILAIGGVSVLYAVIEAAFGSFMPGERVAPMEILGPVFVGAFFVSTAVGWWAAVEDVSVS